MDKIQTFTQKYTKQNIPQLTSGDTVRVYEKIKEGDKERVQIFEGLVIAVKHGTKGLNATFTVRKISYGIGVERVYPLHSPSIQKIEVVKHDKVRRAKLYYVRDMKGKKKRRKASKMLGLVYEEKVSEPESEVTEEKQKETPGEEGK
jgi:large subunit ribosomal protein L19